MAVVAAATAAAAASGGISGGGGGVGAHGMRAGGGGPYHHQTDEHKMQQQYQYQQQQRGKRPRGEMDGGGLMSSGGGGRSGRAPPPPPTSYANASHAFARLGIPVELPGGGDHAARQQLHLQQTVQQLQATQHLQRRRGPFGGGVVHYPEGASGAPSAGRRSPSAAAAEAAEMPVCFMCHEDVSHWGENAGQFGSKSSPTLLVKLSPVG